MPLVEVGRGPGKCRETLGRVEQISVIAVGALQVLAPQPQSCVACETARSVSEPSGIGR